MDAIDAELAKVPQRINTARELIARATAKRSVPPIAKLLADATRIQKASFSHRIVAKVLPGNLSAVVSITDSRISAQSLDPSALATGGIHLGVAGLRQADFPSALQITYHRRKGRLPSKRSTWSAFCRYPAAGGAKAIFERQAAGRKGRAPCRARKKSHAGHWFSSKARHPAASCRSESPPSWNRPPPSSPINW